MMEVEKLARFGASVRFEDLSSDVLAQLKIRVLDSIGVAIGALGTDVISRVRAQIEELGGNKLASLIGGGASAPDRAAFYNGALVRYLDFMDSYLAPGETFHPSDNLGAVLAAAEYANASGKEFLAALAVAYEVQARLSIAAPLRKRGFDHTTQGAYAAAAGVAKALGLDVEKTANAIAMSGTANNALRVTRTGQLSNWKGLAYPNTAFSAVHLAFLAMRGITGPLEVFEGKKGFKESVSGDFEVDWEKPGFDGVTRSILKKYNAEIHAQSAVDAALELRRMHAISGEDIQSVDVDIFKVAYDIIGGGEEGAKYDIETKEQADHSLPYMIAVSLLDGELYPEQYDPKRITAPDVQKLLRSVRIKPNEGMSARFPLEMPVRLSILLRSGDSFEIEKSSYEGFHDQPMSWNACMRKVRKLAHARAVPQVLDRLEDLVGNLESVSIRELAFVLTNLRNGDRRWRAA